MDGVKIIHQAKTTFSTYKIADQTYNDRPARVLYAGGATPQSGLALDTEPELLFDYIQRLFEIVLSARPERVLVIGGGAFTLPKAILERTSVECVDVVEVDPELIPIAEHYFALPRDQRLKIFTMDGREYIDSCDDASYDVIIIDAFNEYNIPRSLMSNDAAAHYARILTKKGLVAMNFIGFYRGMRTGSTRELAEAFHSVLPRVALFPADTHDSKYEEQNLLLVASKRRFHPDYVQSDDVARDLD